MLFPTIDFAVFFVIVFTGSWMLRPYAKPWRWFLLLASCVFYLDPFNPVHTEGQAFLNVSIPILVALVAMGLATTGILRVGFGTNGGPAAVTALGSRGRRPAGRAPTAATTPTRTTSTAAAPRRSSRDGDDGSPRADRARRASGCRRWSSALLRRRPTSGWAWRSPIAPSASGASCSCCSAWPG